MPIIHNESFHESDPFQLRRFGYDMEGGPEVEYTEVARTPSFYNDPQLGWEEIPVKGKEPVPAAEPSLARFVAYWTPERRAQRVAEELQS